MPTHPTKQDGEPNCQMVIMRELGCDQEVSERVKSLGQCGEDRLDLDRNCSRFRLVSGPQHEAGPWHTGGPVLHQDLCHTAEQPPVPQHTCWELER